MLKFSAGLVAVFGASFMLGTYVNASLGLTGGAQAGGVSTKGNRMAASAGPAAPRPVATIEVLGLDGATVILRDKAGEIVYRHDGARNTTIVSRDVDLPTITVRERADSPTQPQPVQKPATPSRKTVGCEGVVSTLVKSEMARIPSLCLT
ncbi:hypothetical protein [Salinarimonas soli]|uniref:Uncharacterized protein n=1 Tax=Salinarimonas soli TaxID=1638099 RepID=A0A5B2VE31_9HYPH|nr:hypothetical protein [Salinarimonas soli]KAA2237224.1 hypothetical protein F0L46_09415 [Salinarimonas soli]